MKSAVVLCLAVAASAVTVEYTPQANTAGTWFGDASDWDAGRFPRGGDDVIIGVNEQVTYSGPRPNGPVFFYQGATEGDKISIGGGGKLTVSSGSKISIGPQDNAPEDCSYPQWSSWAYPLGGTAGSCSEVCDTGVQSRSRQLTQPRYGGDACPHSVENQDCNTQPCTCQTDGGERQHMERYSGFGKNHCNECTCNNGSEGCTTRDCNIAAGSQICDSTTCVYGVKLDSDPDNVLSVADLVAQYPNDNFPAFEYTTLVRHDHVDANGGTFKCGHDGTDCKCYCTQGSDHQIWHRDDRHTDAVSLGLSQAGCECQSACDTSTEPYVCEVVPGSCPSNVNTVTHSSTHDVCDPSTMKSHYKVTVPELYHTTTR